MELTSRRARARIDTEHGGRLASLVVDGREVLITDEDSADPLQWGCYPMVPWAGRVADGRFDWDGAQHQLPITLGPHAIHGTGYLSRWSPGDNDRIEFVLDDPWPWSGSVESVFALDHEALRWTLAVSNHDQAPWPVMVGWHPWFRRTIDGASAELAFEAGAQMERDDRQIPTGSFIEPVGGPWDDCFTDVAQPVQLSWPGLLGLELRSDCTHWVVYTEPEHAVCVEPQSDGPDAFNRPTERQHVVAPGHTLTRWFEIRWAS